MTHDDVTQVPLWRLLPWAGAPMAARCRSHGGRDVLRRQRQRVTRRAFATVRCSDGISRANLSKMTLHVSPWKELKTIIQLDGLLLSINTFLYPDN